MEGRAPLAGCDGERLVKWFQVARDVESQHLNNSRCKSLIEKLNRPRQMENFFAKKTMNSSFV